MTYPFNSRLNSDCIHSSQSGQLRQNGEIIQLVVKGVHLLWPYFTELFHFEQKPGAGSMRIAECAMNIYTYFIYECISKDQCQNKAAAVKTPSCYFSVMERDKCLTEG